MTPIIKSIFGLLNRILGLLGVKLVRIQVTGPSSSKSTETLFAPTTLFPISTPEETTPKTPLLDLFLNSSDGTLHKWFHYFEFYHRFFSPYLTKPNLRILEIGVFRGGSLKMWRNYFPKDATIVGLDINPECKKFDDPKAGIHVRIGSQQDATVLQSIEAEFGPFDIIIDDGSHVSDHMITTFKQLYIQALKLDGIYYVEDTHTNYFEIQSGLPEASTFMQFSRDLIDLLNEPYMQVLEIEKYNFNSSSKLGSLNVSAFCKTTKSITFVDSIVVFEKRPAGYLPNHQIR